LLERTKGAALIYDAQVAGQVVRVEVRGTDGRYTVTLDGRPLEVDYRETGRGFASLLVDGRSHDVGISSQPGGYRVLLDGHDLLVELAPAARGAAAAPARAAAGPQRITSPMPGKIVRVLVEAGQPVAAEQGLLVIEAMKMENELRAPRAGRVRETHAREGQAVESGALLVVIE
jgi:acetyl/propionyl-CoA carboxylase alpha subunit